jgi:hypothetical protein
MMAEVNMNMLSLKQEFVRYVSHEIRLVYMGMLSMEIIMIWTYQRIQIMTRSPLNVVHAGLDIVRSDVEAQSLNLGASGVPSAGRVHISAETAEMIEQIFAASSTAIEILDDLLVYEHIDSGNWDVITSLFHMFIHFPRN